MARKMMLVMLFISVAIAVLVVCEQLRDAYANAASRILEKPWQYNGHNSRQISIVRFWVHKQPGDNDRLEVNPQVPKDCFLAGFLGGFAVLGMNGFRAWRRRFARRRPHPHRSLEAALRAGSRLCWSWESQRHLWSRWTPTH